eukprot:5273719-Pleurochrysis_carterae.AAC.2
MVRLRIYTTSSQLLTRSSVWIDAVSGNLTSDKVGQHMRAGQVDGALLLHKVLSQARTGDYKNRANSDLATTVDYRSRSTRQGVRLPVLTCPSARFSR